MSSQYKDLDAPNFIPGPLWKKSSSSMSLERADERLGLWSQEEPQFETDSDTYQLCRLCHVP